MLLVSSSGHSEDRHVYSLSSPTVEGRYRRLWMRPWHWSNSEVVREMMGDKVGTLWAVLPAW